MSPCPGRVLGATTVSLEQLVANPGLPLSLSHVPLLDPQGQPTGVSTPLQRNSTLGCHWAQLGVSPVPSQCTLTLRCSYIPHGTPGDVAVPLQGQVPPRAASPGTSQRPNKPPAKGKEDFQV